MSGWIKLHRKMLDWEWYTEPNTFRLFMHLLLHVNHEDKNWRGIPIPAGSILTGRHSLSEKTGLTERQVRTALKNLKSTGEVTSKTSNKYSIISIVKWRDYQSSDQQSTSNRPAIDQQSTTTKECNNEKNIRSKYTFDEFYLRYPIKKSKEPAKKAWAKLPVADRDAAVDLLQNYLDANNPEYYAHPSTYLNQKRWQDESSQLSKQPEQYRGPTI